MSKWIVLPLTALMLLSAGIQPADAQFKRAKDVMNHLKRHGYQVEKKDDHLSAKHVDWLNMTLREYKGGILLRAWLETTQYDTDDLETLANTLNYRATATRIYIDDENDLIYEAWFPGLYDKKRFEVLLNAWHDDTIGQGETVREYLGM